MASDGPEMFSHVIMTRFNLATPGRESVIRNQPDWLENRFDLFERYCLPSIAAQTEKNFHWIIYFDEETPDVFRERILRLQGEVPFHAYFTGLFDASGWPRSVREVVAPKTPLLLSTRLDNDDALSGDFVGRVQGAVTDANYALGTYNIRHGLIRRERAVYSLEHPANPFFSLLEPLDGAFRTAGSIAHLDIAKYGAVRQIMGRPGWMQIVHGQNVSNKVRGSRVAPDIAKAQFTGEAATGYDTISPAALLLENALLAPLRSGRDRLASIARSGLK